MIHFLNLTSVVGETVFRMDVCTFGKIVVEVCNGW